MSEKPEKGLNLEKLEERGKALFQGLGGGLTPEKRTVIGLLAAVKELREARAKLAKVHTLLTAYRPSLDEVQAAFVTASNLTAEEDAP